MRPAVREEVESLGANWLDLGVVGEETAGGYAQGADAEEQQRRSEQLEARLPEFDVVITTALMPGRPAPRLIPAARCAAMRPGSVIVDLAAEAGGNCELTEPGEEVVRDGVTIVGLHEPAEHDAVPREPDVLRATSARCLQHLAPERRRSRSTGRRDHRRRLRDPRSRGAGVSHNTLLVFELTIFVLAVFVGFEVISKVPTCCTRR